MNNAASVLLLYYTVQKSCTCELKCLLFLVIKPLYKTVMSTPEHDIDMADICQEIIETLKSEGNTVGRTSLL